MLGTRCRRRRTLTKLERSSQPGPADCRGRNAHLHRGRVLRVCDRRARGIGREKLSMSERAGRRPNSGELERATRRPNSLSNPSNGEQTIRAQADKLLYMYEGRWTSGDDDRLGSRGRPRSALGNAAQDDRLVSIEAQRGRQRLDRIVARRTEPAGARTGARTASIGGAERTARRMRRRTRGARSRRGDDRAAPKGSDGLAVTLRDAGDDRSHVGRARR